MLPVLCVIVALFLTIRHSSSSSVYRLTNYLGDAAKSVATHGNLDLTMDDAPFSGSVVFHAARMPLPPVFLACANEIAGGRMQLVFLLKTVIFLLPLVAAAWLAYSHAERKLLALLLLVLPFLIPNFLLLTTSMQIEEGFYYGLLALLVAILIFQRTISAWWLALTLVALLYSKSSLHVVCVVALLIGCYRIASWRARAAVALPLICAALAWGIYQHHVSGRFTQSSSLDAMNFHKGNNETFLSHYPPADNGYIDQYDYTLSPAHMFSNEWAYSDYHMHQALLFIRNHPRATLRADAIKAWIYWASLRDIGSGHYQDVFTQLDPINMLLMRLIMLGAVGTAFFALFRSADRADAIILLAIFGAVCLPYLVGFSLTRHASVLIYPSSLGLVRFYAFPTSVHQS